MTTDELLQLVLGDLPSKRRDRALLHIDMCPDCQLLMGEAGRALRDSGGGPARSSNGVFAAGDTVAQRYRVERFIARGGMGEVYAVHDTVLDDHVALKTLRAASPGNVKAVRRLKSEAQLSRRIGHPNTCRIYDFGEHDLAGGGVLYFFTMGLVEGETLGVKVRRDGPFEPQIVMTLARQVLGAMAEAHSLGILHRDLKSDNIMLRLPPAPGLAVDAVIMDFGLALRLDSDERLTSDSHALIGSAAYMAPEQVEGEKLSPATDVYAFGVILFEMLTGRLPFRAATTAATALQRLRQPAPAPSSLAPNLDRAWDSIVLGCLERSVERRFSSARDVSSALDELEARPRAEHSSGRRKRIIAIAAGVVVIAWSARAWLGAPSKRGSDAEPPRVSTARASETLIASSLPIVSSPEAQPDPPLPLPGAAASVPGSAAEAVLKTSAPRKSHPSRAVRVHPVQLEPPALPQRPGPSSAEPVEVAPSALGPEPAAPPAPAVDAPVGPLPIDSEYPR